MSKPQAEKEKRSIRRVKTHGKVAVKVGNGLASDAEAQLRDVSMQGVYLFLQNRVAEGSSLELVLPLPNGVLAGPQSWLRCKCRVVRVEAKGGPQYGVAAMIEDFEPLDSANLPQA